MGQDIGNITSLQRLIEYAHDESKCLDDSELSALLLDVLSKLKKLNLQKKQAATTMKEMRLETKNKKG